MIIRCAESRDIPGMLTLLGQVGQVHHEIRPDIFCPGAQKYDAAALEILLQDEEKPIFVAVEGDFVTGYCFCQLRNYAGSTVLTERTELYIDDLCVDENCRHRGIASALYAHTLDFAKSLGCAFVTLNVWNGSDNAMRFYENLGMTPRSITMETKLC